MSIRLCLFDLDDTLVMTSDLAQFRGTGNVNNTSAVYLGGIANAFAAYPKRHIYTPAILDELRAKHPEMKWGVFTRSPRAYAHRILDLAYPRFAWDVVVGFEDVKHTKPYPDGIHMAMKQVGVKYINHTMMVGDSKSDIMAAYHAGVWVTLDQSGWPDPRVSENWWCLERLPDASIGSTDQLSAVLADPAGHAPLLDRLTWSGGAPTLNGNPARIEKINHFKPKPLGGGTYPINCLGRMFGAYQSLANRAKWHTLTEQILAHKDSTEFPEAWLFACREFLKKEVANRLGGAFIVTVIPAKPGRLQRLEWFLGHLQAYIRNNPIPNGRIEFAIDVMAYGPGALSHHGPHLNRDQRFENVRDNLSVINAEAVRRKHVVVLDDVVTTGASLIFASTYLRAAGATSVTCLAFAKAISSDL